MRAVCTADIDARLRVRASVWSLTRAGRDYAFSQPNSLTPTLPGQGGPYPCWPSKAWRGLLAGFTLVGQREFVTTQKDVDAEAVVVVF
jgi:hypothetical protein